MDASQDNNSNEAVDVKVSSVEPVAAPVDESVPAEQQATTTQNIETADKQSVDQATPGPEQTQSASHEPSRPQQPKAKAPILAIVMAVVVAIGLAAITVYAYMQSQDERIKPAESTQSNETEQEPAVTDEDISSVETEIDNALTTEEESDFPEEELSDQSLGL